MLIVVSDAQFLKGEADIVNALFDEGLQLLHLRKPEASASEIQQALEKINSVHLSKIALHQHHSLAKTFEIKRLHYPEWKRKNSTTEEWKRLKEEGYHLSTSVHQLNEIVDAVFDYVFFGPVFDSISKKGYAASLIKHSPLTIQHSRLIAIGGIDEKNCTIAFEMGFAGVAVLGAIWQSGEPFKQFKKIQNKCSSIAQL